MADYAAIVRATRASANAVTRMTRHAILCHRTECGRDADISLEQAKKRYDRARRDYDRAQAILAANPLPGDR